MKTRKFTTFLLVGFLMIGCKSTQKIVLPNAKLDALIEKRAFRMEVNAVQPQITTALAQLNNSQLVRPGNTLSNINVRGEGYFIQMDGDSVSANLPYYGERQMGGGYGSDGRIEFKETAKDLTIEKAENKNSYQVAFGVSNSEEYLRFMITIENNFSSSVQVSSSHRNRIRFTGKVEKLEPSEQQ